MSWSFWDRVSCISWNLTGSEGDRIQIRDLLNKLSSSDTNTEESVYYNQQLQVSSPVVSLLQKLFQPLELTHLQMCFICVLVTDERTAVPDEESQISDRSMRGNKKQFLPSGDLPIFGVWTFDVLTFFEVSLQVHGEQRGAGGVVGAADWPVVTAVLMFSVETELGWGGKRSVKALCIHRKAAGIQHPQLLLPCGQFNGERAAQWVHFIRSRLPGHCGIGGCGPSCPVRRGPAAVFTVDEELSYLLGHCDVVYHHGELSRIHWALVCEGHQHKGELTIHNTST